MDSGHIEASFRFAESVLISEVSGLKGVESSLERCPHFWSVFIVGLGGHFGGRREERWRLVGKKSERGEKEERWNGEGERRGERREMEWGRREREEKKGGRGERWRRERGREEKKG